MITVDSALAATPVSRGRGKKRAHDEKEVTLPPSIRRRLDDLLNATRSSTWHADMPCVRSLEDAKCLAPAWASVLANAAKPARCEPVPISLAAHEDRMLTYGRKVPLCCLGEGCAALQYPTNCGPLPIYVMPSVQRLIDQGVEPPCPFSQDATCLLCIRRDVHAAVLAWGSMIGSPDVQINKSACCPPPFANLVDVPGGYHASAIITTGKHNVLGPASIVGCHHNLECVQNPETKQYGFDQSALKVVGPAFLG